MNTRRSYAREWERWEAYVFEHGTSALPESPLVVAAYIAHLDAEGLSPISLDVAMAAIVDRHRVARVALPSNDPVVRDVLVEIRARRGARPRAKAPLLPTDLRAMIEALSATVLGARDRALLLVGFAAALRRAELVALDVAHIGWHRERIIVHVARSKTEQLGEGADVPCMLRRANCVQCRRFMRGSTFRRSLEVQSFHVSLDGVVSGQTRSRVERWRSS